MNLNISPILLPSIKLTYREFLSTQAGGDSFMRFRRALYTESDSLVQVLNSCVLQGLPMVRKDVLRVCDIGGADGTRVRSILRFLHAKFGIRFALDFVEQSTYLMGALSECDISGFTQTQRFEMLFEDATLRGPYDLVLLIHSIFAFENGPTVDKVLSLAAGDSTIVAVSNSQESLLELRVPSQTPVLRA